MNTVSLTGRLVRDPEVRSTHNGTSVCQLRLAVDRMARGEGTGYIDVATFGNQADAAARHLIKGQRVGVEGKLDYQEWQGQDGARRHAITVVGRVEFLDRPRNTDDKPEPESEGVGAENADITF